MTQLRVQLICVQCDTTGTTLVSVPNVQH